MTGGVVRVRTLWEGLQVNNENKSNTKKETDLHGHDVDFQDLNRSDLLSLQKTLGE